MPTSTHIEYDGTGHRVAAEEGMLQFVPSRSRGSRLSCRRETKQVLDGLALRLPEFRMQARRGRSRGECGR